MDEKIRVRALREKETRNRITRDWGYKTLAHGGTASVSWKGQASVIHSRFLEVRVYGRHIWKAGQPDSIVAVTYARDRVEEPEE